MECKSVWDDVVHTNLRVPAYFYMLFLYNWCGLNFNTFCSHILESCIFTKSVHTDTRWIPNNVPGKIIISGKHAQQGSCSCLYLVAVTDSDRTAFPRIKFHVIHILDWHTIWSYFVNKSSSLRHHSHPPRELCMQNNVMNPGYTYRL